MADATNQNSTAPGDKSEETGDQSPSSSPPAAKSAKPDKKPLKAITAKGANWELRIDGVAEQIIAVGVAVLVVFGGLALLRSRWISTTWWGRRY